MKIAFYAPMKPASSPVPSGDREMARNLIAALSRNHEVEVASEFVSRDGKGEPAVQKRIAVEGQAEARRLVRNWRDGPIGERPDAWFTYHVYHKAPDWIGPAVSRALNIPYFMAEVSHAPKQAGGPWDTGYRAAEEAIRGARGIVGLSGLDAACVLPLLDDPGRYHRLAPFTDIAPFRAAAQDRTRHRDALVGRFGLPAGSPVLLAVGMMRHGDKLASYRVLSEAMQRLGGRPWSLLVVGDGPARQETEALFATLPASRLRFAGAATPDALPAIHAAADLMVWPSVNEAYGMAMLEAQASGLPVVAGETGGVPDVIRDGETGLLCPVGDADAFAGAVDSLLDAKQRLRDMSARALARTAADHDISAAAERLDGILRAGRAACAA